MVAEVKFWKILLLPFSDLEIESERSVGATGLKKMPESMKSFT